MNLGGMVDLGVPLDYLRDELAKLGLDEFRITAVRAKRKGIEGTLVTVTETVSHTHLAHSSVAMHTHTSQSRNYSDIIRIIRTSSLNPNVQELSLNIFGRVAEAEAKIHGVPVEKVHFHEVGAIDSIVDIVGAAICIDYLKPDRVISAPPELGKGLVTCDHGVFPVPAPATAEILKGIPVRLGNADHEATTPTGAAILAALTDEFTGQTEMEITRTGYGIGYRDTAALPNVLRVLLATTSGKTGTEEAMMLECNIDDMNPEHYEYLITKMLEMGADDVYITPILMKKTRPAHKLSVLCKNELAATLTGFILTETSTLGLRQYPVKKSILDRKTALVHTPWGEVRIKQALMDSRVLRSKPEYDDCVKIARTHNLPLQQVMNEVQKEMKKLEE